MKLIPLTQGKFARVDNQDFERVNQFKWFAQKQRTGNYYAYRRIRLSNSERASQAMHQFLLPGVKEVDHIDTDGLNNQRENIRPVTRTQNNTNRRKFAGCSSRFKGVCWYGRDEVWAARIRVGQRCVFLGNYESEEDAAHVYDYAARIYFGEFARLNFPD